MTTQRHHLLELLERTTPRSAARALIDELRGDVGRQPLGDEIRALKRQLDDVCSELAAEAHNADADQARERVLENLEILEQPKRGGPP